MALTIINAVAIHFGINRNGMVWYKVRDEGGLKISHLAQ